MDDSAAHLRCACEKNLRIHHMGIAILLSSGEKETYTMRESLSQQAKPQQPHQIQITQYQKTLSLPHSE